MFQVPGLIILDMSYSVAVTGSGNEDHDVDDKCAKFFECLLEAREKGFGGPYIGSGVFEEVGEAVIQRRALETGILVKSTVYVIGTFEGVVVA